MQNIIFICRWLINDGSSNQNDEMEQIFNFFRTGNRDAGLFVLVLLSRSLGFPSERLNNQTSRCSSSLYKRHTSSLTYRAVHEAVVWRVLHVHQLILGASLKASVGNHEAGPVLVHGDLGGRVVLLAQVVSRPPEV